MIHSTTLTFCGLVLSASVAFADSEVDADEDSVYAGITPDIREDELDVKLQRGDFVVVPIPISNPTLDTGLVVGGAYFYAQSEAQKKVQPASVTAALGMYTSNDSKAYGIAQQNYWAEDRWRFGGVLGRADLRLRLLAPDLSGGGSSVDWLLDGKFGYVKISRKFAGDWYAGLEGRVVDMKQDIDFSLGGPVDNFGDLLDSRSVGLGIDIDYDNRDMPLNTYSGSFFQVKALFNDEDFGSDQTYQSYGLAYRSYHEMSLPLVLAWEIEGCQKAGRVPLWDACNIGLRGFPVTDYLGKVSAAAQIEARWRMTERWGVVGFAGGGYVGNSFSQVRENELIPSYGIGLRFMVMKAKRINLRLDYARSTGSDAIHVSVGEAF